MIYAVIDTNVLVSALLTSNMEAATVKVLEALLKEQIIPLYNEEIIGEYTEVLSRPKFGFSDDLVGFYISSIMQKGILASRVTSNEVFLDADDAVFYEVALSRDDAFVVTGNLKHFPKNPIVVTPAELLDIMKQKS